MTTRSERGFTLLEVMVALSLFATLAVAIYGASGHLVGTASAMTERQLALWIADNHLTELRAGIRDGQLGQRSEALSFADRRWQLAVNIQRAPDPRLLRVELKVYTDNPPHLRASLSGFIEAER
ncbi:type II secretion system minor pseudopilin GspI [Pseudomonas sp. R5(2019)]|uniref:type II secretion system minor pseudopilin GspI n=1 Tax=Pseudomonas sp. R5(2019) TaxID=2697566 RepID=UPI00211541B3|nr:type II secretion system minor pseudopilin GspI [Pseudomonas sp. R5(2019)]